MHARCLATPQALCRDASRSRAQHTQVQPPGSVPGPWLSRVNCSRHEQPCPPTPGLGSRVEGDPAFSGTLHRMSDCLHLLHPYSREPSDSRWPPSTRNWGLEKLRTNSTNWAQNFYTGPLFYHRLKSLAHLRKWLYIGCPKKSLHTLCVIKKAVFINIHLISKLELSAVQLCLHFGGRPILRDRNSPLQEVAIRG